MKVMSVLSIPYMFTAPASFIACPVEGIPVEGIFESLMAINFEEIPISSPQPQRSSHYQTDS